MKKFLSFLFIAFALSAQASDQVKIMVFSDPHVLHESLLPTTEASETFASSLMLTEYSQALFDEALRIVGDSAPDVLLIPGDLAYNGDSTSLQYVAEELNKLTTEKQVRVFIIPGNHDINEPTAQSYNPAVESKGISLERFLEFYHDCGYAEAVAIAEDHISYRANLSDSLALIAINSAMDNSKGHMSAGGITEETLAWVEEQAAAAMEEGRYPIAMTHHQLLSHFDQQSKIDDDHIANSNADVLIKPTLAEVQARLLNAGITTIFTGHMHIQSIKDVCPSQNNTHSRTLYDISTNSLSGYGAAIRTITIEDGGFASLSSTEIGDLPTLTYDNRQLLAKARLQNMAGSALNMASNVCKSKLGEPLGSLVAKTLKEEMEKYMLEDYSTLFAKLSQGEEYRDPAAAVTFAAQCESDFEKVDSAIYEGYKFFFNAVTKPLYDNAVNEGKTMLKQMVSSIMFNCTDWTGDTSLYNRISDFSPTIAKQYVLTNPSSDFEHTAADSDRGTRATKYLRGAELIILRDGKAYNILGTER